MHELPLWCRRSMSGPSTRELSVCCVWETLGAIWVHHVRQDSQLDEVIENMKYSCAGSIRNAPNVITVAAQCHNLGRDVRRLGRD